MQVVLTDVTYMSGTHVCIAGWDMGRKRLVRPILAGQHWTTADIGRNKFRTGTLVTFTETARHRPTNFPHATEDVAVTGRYQIGRTLGHGAVDRQVASSLTINLDRYFGFSNPMSEKRHALDGVKAPSLGGIIVPAHQVRFFETSWNKLRCRFVMPNQHPYDFPVTSVDLRDTWKQGGLKSLRTLMHGKARLHLRIGLARGWSPQAGPLVCYAQLNNLLLI